ncbi:hypothetical protein [Allohahella sp. A8]
MTALKLATQWNDIQAAAATVYFLIIPQSISDTSIATVGYPLSGALQ